MSTQIFKNQIPNELLFELLGKICSKTDKYFIFNKNSFKKGVFDSLFSTFIELLTPYYQLSKRKYLERKLTYNSFTTILRQICNFNKIKYTSQIKYDKSVYDIVYYIYFVNE
jgi:hypothetical protein